MAQLFQATGGMLSGASNAATAVAKMIYTAKDLKVLYNEVENGIRDLRSKQEDKRAEVRRKHSTQDINEECLNWIHDVSLLNCEITESLPQYESRIKATGWTDVDWINVAKDMETDKKRISDLSQRGNSLRNILVLKEPVPVVKKENVPDIKGYKTLEEPLNEIIDLLQKEEVKGIELYGILGTGKSTIMQNLNNRKEVAKMFGIVIWLDVSSDTNMMDGRNYSLKTLQRDVMKRLNLQDDLAREDLYKQNISKKLEGKRYLLLLDGVKESLKIDDIGFPDPSKKDSKVVLTSRKKNVFHSLDTYPVEVTRLTREEAKTMFLANLKPLEKYDQQSKNLMPKALKWCDGLPAAINIVAGYFKSRTDKDSWKNGLYILYNYWPQQGDDVIEEIYGRFKFCCENVKDADKNCFYHSALYAEESKIYIDRLLDCWVALDFCTTRARGRIALESLNNQNLFQEDKRNIYVRINKLIRLVALHNLQTDGKHKFLVLSNKESLDQQDMESWKEKHWISLADNKNLKTITGTPDCSVLSTLFLQGNSNFKEFPDNFFQQMGSLCVLDVMGTDITSLPNFTPLPNSSTNVEPTKLKPTKLKVLYLNRCTNLVSLPSEIGNLTLLEVLDISGCRVDLTLTPQIQSLTNLKRLVLSSHAFSTVHGEISHLPKLQEIVIDTELNREMYEWEINDLVMKAVADLRHLTSVQFRFLNDEVVEVISVEDDVTRIYAQKEDDLINFVQKEGLDSFEVFIGCQISPDLIIPESEIYKRYVKYYDGKDSSPTFLKLLPKADSLVIDTCDLEHLSELSNSSTVIGCLIKNCRIISHIYGKKPILSNLERLYLSDLQELKSMWVECSECSIPKLKTLVLTRCPKLTVLITQDAVDKIQSQCNAGQELQVFPDLEKLILVEMRDMTSICEDVALDWLSLKSVEISKSPKLCSLPFSRSNAKNLASIKAEETWFEALTWTNDGDKQHFQGHCTFV